jgi:hypothetical protein
MCCVLFAEASGGSGSAKSKSAKKNEKRKAKKADEKTGGQGGSSTQQQQQQPQQTSRCGMEVPVTCIASLPTWLAGRGTCFSFALLYPSLVMHARRQQ